MSTESKRTVLVALAANIAVSLAKLVGGLVTGSAAMLSEAAHSVADVINELFLLTSLQRSTRPADAQHPFGYGMERFFWSLLAAVGIFVAGAGFSVLEAYRSFAHGAGPISGRYYVINYAVLAVALVSEGTSLLRAGRQLHDAADRARRPLLSFFLDSSDPSVKTVASEDTAAVIGIALAGGGLVLHQVTGAGWWEGLASALIAVLLIVVAISLGRDSKGLLIGEAAIPELTDAVRAYLEDDRDELDAVVELLTMHIGANQVLLAARVDLADDLTSTDIEQLCESLDREIQQRWPAITQVFIDPTGRAEQRRAARQSTS
jgi:cation diffusion facilitator family transporter